LGFRFSVIGVFYIYLVIYWSQKGSSFWAGKWTITLFSIPVGIFILMLPVVHSVFGMTSLWQLLTPILSLLFAPFYPLAIGLHLIGCGGLLDRALLWLFSLPSEHYEHLLPHRVVGIYLLFSVAAIWSRILFVLTFGSALLYFSYLFLFVQ
jgi:competence protein ComEC